MRKYDIKPQAIIPTRFNKKIGLNWLLEAIMEHFTEPTDNQEKGIFWLLDHLMLINQVVIGRSIKVIGGSLINGALNWEIK